MQCLCLCDRARFANEQYEYGMIEGNLHDSPLGAACMPSPMCPNPPSRYASLDGTCNNPIYSAWGSTFTPFTRLLPPDYDDGTVFLNVLRPLVKNKN